MIGIIGAMEEEVTLLRGEMSGARTETCGCFEFYRGTLAGKEVALLRCGIGKVQAAVGCVTMIHRFDPSLIINTGSAGGINPRGVAEELHFGDAVISSELVQHDFDITAFGYARGQIPGRDSAFFTVDPLLVAQAENAVRALREEGKLPETFTALPGLIASGDSFISNTDVVRALETAFPRLRAVEMEGAAVAHAASLFRVPFLVLRCLSDIAGEESPLKFDEYLPIAARNSSEIVKRLLSSWAA